MFLFNFGLHLYKENSFFSDFKRKYVELDDFRLFPFQRDVTVTLLFSFSRSPLSRIRAIYTYVYQYIRLLALSSSPRHA